MSLSKAEELLMGELLYSREQARFIVRQFDKIDSIGHRTGHFGDGPRSQSLADSSGKSLIRTATENSPPRRWNSSRIPSNRRQYKPREKPSVLDRGSRSDRPRYRASTRCTPPRGATPPGALMTSQRKRTIYGRQSMFNANHNHLSLTCDLDLQCQASCGHTCRKLEFKGQSVQKIQ